MGKVMFYLLNPLNFESQRLLYSWRVYCIRGLHLVIPPSVAGLDSVGILLT